MGFKNTTVWCSQDKDPPDGADAEWREHSKGSIENFAAHEFGHMIFQPDEYERSWDKEKGDGTFEDIVGRDPEPEEFMYSNANGDDVYSAIGSVMGQNVNDPALPRHVQLFADWLNSKKGADEPEFYVLALAALECAAWAD